MRIARDYVMHNLYKRLGVPIDATKDELLQAIIRCSDASVKPDAECVLLNSKSRCIYDQTHATLTSIAQIRHGLNLTDKPNWNEQIQDEFSTEKPTPQSEDKDATAKNTSSDSASNQPVIPKGSAANQPAPEIVKSLNTRAKKTRTNGSSIYKWAIGFAILMVFVILIKFQDTDQSPQLSATTPTVPVLANKQDQEEARIARELAATTARLVEDQKQEARRLQLVAERKQLKLQNQEVARKKEEDAKVKQQEANSKEEARRKQLEAERKRLQLQNQEAIRKQLEATRKKKEAEARRRAELAHRVETALSISHEENYVIQYYFNSLTLTQLQKLHEAIQAEELYYEKSGTDLQRLYKLKRMSNLIDRRISNFEHTQESE